MARIDSIFKEETKKAELHPKRVTKWIHYSKLVTNKKQYRYGQSNAPEEQENVRERVEALAELIATDGEVLQDLLVRKIDTDVYEILSGHYRRDACKLLVEERGKDEYALLPCVEKNISDVRAEFQVYSSNGYGKKTQYEIMCELEGMQHLLETYPEEFPDLQGGRMVERLAKQLHMDKTTVGDYQKISRRLGDKGMEKFRGGTLKKSAALELTALPQVEQDKLMEIGVTSSTEIVKYKQERTSEELMTEPAETKKLEKPYGTSEEIINVPDSGTTVKTETEDTKNEALPQLKNMEQREAFVNAYEKWTIWTKNELTEETYYRYDLPDGSAIVVREYPFTNQWNKETYKGTDLFLLTKDQRHFKDAAASMTIIKEHLSHLRGRA